MIKTLFLGSNWQSVKILETLKNDIRFNIVGCITQPDKPVGRKQILTPTEVKQYCIDNSIEVFHTENSPEKYQEALDRYQPELVVCIAYGEIVPKFFLEYPKYKAINIHFSILPKYRGAVPIQMAILNGDSVTGITVTQMAEKMDAGPILKIYQTTIREDDTNQSLRERLVDLSCSYLPDVLSDWCSGKIEAVEQNSEEATYCFKDDISKEKAELDFENMDSGLIDRMIRAYIPWPLTWFMYKGKRVIIHSARLVEGISLKPGEMKKVESQLFIGTKDENKLIEILQLQVEGKNMIDAKDFTLN